jgi:hypothetical protein
MPFTGPSRMSLAAVRFVPSGQRSPPHGPGQRPAQPGAPEGIANDVPAARVAVAPLGGPGMHEQFEDVAHPPAAGGKVGCQQFFLATEEQPRLEAAGFQERRSPDHGRPRQEAEQRRCNSSSRGNWSSRRVKVAQLMNAGGPCGGPSRRNWMGHVRQRRLHCPTGSTWRKVGSGTGGTSGRAGDKTGRARGTKSTRGRFMDLSSKGERECQSPVSRSEQGVDTPRSPVCGTLSQ